MRLRLGQDEPGLALLGDAGVGGEISDNEGIEGGKHQKKPVATIRHFRGFVQLWRTIVGRLWSRLKTQKARMKASVLGLGLVVDEVE